MADNDEKKEKKIVLFPRTEKAIQRTKDNTIDISSPVGTVYGVQQWINGVLQGTSLYSDQAKQNFVLRTLRREYAERLKTMEFDSQREEYRAINYPVY